MIVSLVIVALFVWTLVGGVTPNSALYVPILPGAFAAVTFAVTLSSYFTVPKDKLRTSIVLDYILLAITVFVLVLSSDTGSPFIALFAVILAAGPFIGMNGAIASIVGALIFVVIRLLITHNSFDTIVALALALLTPIAALCAVWFREYKETAEDRSYDELKSNLSRISGMSDVVISAIGDGVISIDAKGVITLINPAAQQLIGWGNQDAVGLSYKSVIELTNQQDGELKDSDDIIAGVLNTGNPVKTEQFKIKTQSGKSFMASISVKPVGKGNGAVIVFRDITSERSKERQQAEFISTASHEMRTPVASIEGYLGLAMNPQTATVDARAKDYLTKAHESAVHLGNLFQDLLDVSKADDHRISNNPKVTDVADFLSDIVEGLTPKAEAKGLTINYAPDKSKNTAIGSTASRVINPIYYANVDNDHLREIVQNLVENAIKYTPTGSVTVDVTGDEDQVTISVADSGIGIPREDIPHLFQKFYRVDNTDTRKIGGTGLGLYLCRKLAETIGGRIWVESEYQHGSTFYVSVPRIDQANVERLKAQEPKQEKNNEAAAATEPFVEPVAPQSTQQVQQTVSVDHTSQLQAPQVSQNTPPIQPNYQQYTPSRYSIPQQPIITPQPAQQSATSQRSAQTMSQPQPYTISSPAPQQIAPQYTQQQATQSPSQAYSAPVNYQPPQQNQQQVRETRYTNTPITSIEAEPVKYAQQLRNEMRLSIPPREGQ